MAKPKQYLNEQEIKLTHEYILQGLSIFRIHQLLKYNTNTIERAIRDNNIQYKPKRRTYNITLEQELEIVKEYKLTNSLAHVKRKYKYDFGAIKKILRKHINYKNTPKTTNYNIIIKNLTHEKELEIINNFKKYKTLEAVKNIYKCGNGTIKKILQKYGIEHKKIKNGIRLAKLLPAQEQDIVSMYKSLNNILPIKKKYKCGSNTIIRILQRHNIVAITKKQHLEKIAAIPKQIEQLIIHDYTKERLTISEIGKKYKVNKGSVSKFLRHNKVSTQKKSKPIRCVLFSNKQEALDIYNKNKKIIDVAKHFNTDSNNIISFFKSENIPYDKNNHYNFTREDLETMIKIQLDKKLSLEQLAKQYNCDSQTLTYYFKKHNLKWHTITYKNYTLPSGKIIKLQGYENSYLDFIFENNLLTEQEIVIKPNKIQYNENGKNRWYFPDFYIPKFNLIVETKSDFVLKYRQAPGNEQRKKKACIEQGYNYILIINNNFAEFEKICNAHKEQKEPSSNKLELA